MARNKDQEIETEENKMNKHGKGYLGSKENKPIPQIARTNALKSENMKPEAPCLIYLEQAGTRRGGNWGPSSIAKRDLMV